MLALALFIAIAAFTAGGFVAGWMACAAFQAAEDGSDQGAEGVSSRSEIGDFSSLHAARNTPGGLCDHA